MYVRKACGLIQLMNTTLSVQPLNNFLFKSFKRAERSFNAFNEAWLRAAEAANIS